MTFPSLVLLNLVAWIFFFLLSLFRIRGMSQHSELFILRERSSLNVDSPADQPQWLHHYITNHWGLWLHSLTFWHRCSAEWKVSTRPTLSHSGAPLSSFPADWGRCSVRPSTAVKHVSCLRAKESQFGAKESKWQPRCFSTLQWGLSLPFRELRFNSFAFSVVVVGRIFN